MEHHKIIGYKHSTPDSTTGNKLPSLSLSRIDSVSSGRSEEAIEKKLSSPINTTGKQIKKTKKISKRKQRLMFQSKDTDSEWETAAEETIRTFDDEDVENVQSETLIRNFTSPSIHLFEDERSPETVRDVPIEHERLFNSPIITSRFSYRSRSRSRLFRHTKEDIQIAQQHELLPTNLPQVETERSILERSDEDEFILNRQNNVKAYVGPAQKPKINPYESDFLYPRTFTLPSISDILWEEFIAKHRAEQTQDSVSAQASQPSTSALPSAVSPKNVLHRRRYIRIISDSEEENLIFSKSRGFTSSSTETHNKSAQPAAIPSTSTVVPARSPKSKNTYPQGIACDQGYQDQTLSKRKRHSDPKDPDSEDKTRKFFKHRRLNIMAETVFHDKKKGRTSRTKDETKTQKKNKTKARVKGKTAKQKGKETQFQHTQSKKISDPFKPDIADENNGKMTLAEFRHQQIMKKNQRSTSM